MMQPIPIAAVAMVAVEKMERVRDMLHPTATPEQQEQAA
jgi:hypothetical protein